MTYMGRDEILAAEVGVTGITRLIDGVLFELVVGDVGAYGWTAWDDIERSGMRSSVSEEDAHNLGLAT